MSLIFPGGNIMNDFRAQLARTCMQDDPPPCASVCPFGLDIRAFIGHMKRGAFSAAFRLYRDTVAFPGIVSRLRTQPCRAACVFSARGGAVALRDLEAAAIAHAPNIKPNSYNLPRRPNKIAVIGAGPGALACALRLASKKYEVVIFEKEERVGGSLWSLLPEEVFMPELECQFMYEKVDFRLGQRVTDLAQVQADAVYVSTGAGGECFGLELFGQGACASRRDGVFLGGELAGRTVMEAMADGLLAARAIERYLKVGGMNEPFRDFSTRFIATCNHCGLCKEVCPVSLDTGTYLLDSHRRMVEEEAMPWAYHEFWLRDMEFSNGEASLLLDPDGNGNPKYLFFPGCRLGGSDPRLVLDSFRTLLEHEPESALYLGCCGAPAEWAGEEKLHSETVEEFARVWEDLGRPTVVFACLNCRQELARHLPRAEGMSLYELLDSWDLPVFQSGAGQAAAVFDPCPSRDFPETQRAVRSLARKAGFHLDALPLEGEYAQCCGWGGQVEIANPKYAQGVAQNRIEASPLPYLVYCL